MDMLKITDFSEFIDILFEAENIFHSLGEVYTRISQSLGIVSVDMEMNSFNSQKIIQSIYSSSNYSENQCQLKSFQYGSMENLSVTINITFKNQVSEELIKEVGNLNKILYTFVSKRKLEEIVMQSGKVEQSTGLFIFPVFQQKAISLCIENKDSNYSIIFMNTKNFKVINKKYGHGEGTKIISQIGRRLKVFLDGDSFATHLGGDNYLVFINSTYLPIFLKMISRFLVEANTKDNQIEECHLCFHAGVVENIELSISNPMVSLSLIIENAQIAMGISKKNPAGSNVIYFNDEIKQLVQREKEIECCMKDALKNGEFFVCYQPKVDLHTYKLSGAEALVRWKKDNKIIPPISFIPIFEKNGFVCELDFFVLDSVCKKIRYWLENDIEPVKVSVNFSKLHTENPNLVDDVTDVIVRNGIHPKYIEIEFTESSYMDNSNQIKDIISKLRNVGIMVSMDDFGTGYSSLNMLKEMPIDILKIDKSFLNSKGDMNSREKIIVKNVIKMAKELDIEVVSEGVENSEQVRFLQGLECDTAQGYFFDKPLEENDYEQRLKKMIYDSKIND